MKKERTLIISLAALVVGIIAMVSTLQAFTNAVEYKEFTTTGASSTAGTTFQGDVLVCAYNTTGGSFSGTVKVQLYHTLGDGSGEWIDTGDTFTGEACKILCQRGHRRCSPLSVRLHNSELCRPNQPKQLFLGGAG